MSSFQNEITEPYLNKIYEDLQKEQIKLLNDMKSGITNIKESDITKQISTINTINLSILRLRDIRRPKE